MSKVKNILKEYTKKYLIEKQPSAAKDAFSMMTTGEYLDPKAGDVDVSGMKDTSGAASGKADYLLKQIRTNLNNLGFDVDDLDKQKTIAELKVAPFGFTYTLIWPKENEWGERGIVNLTNKGGKVIEMSGIDTRGKITDDDKDGGVVVKTKQGISYYFFDVDELKRTLGDEEGKLPPGKDGENLIRMLEEGLTYKVKINENIIIDPEDECPEGMVRDNETGECVEGEEGDDEEGGDDVDIPDEIRENRNEIFRLLLKNYGKYNGSVVYGDGFDDKEKARAYGRLQRAVRAGKEDKSKLKEFRDKSGRNKYSMMIAALRKSFPNNFLNRLKSAFPEFNLSWNKETFEESFKRNFILEVENADKYKRWSKVFDVSVIGNDTIDILDENIREFMLAVKSWFAVPVKGVGKDSSKRSYKIGYDKDKTNEYWGKFYGKKQESKISLMNILNEVISEADNEEKDYDDFKTDEEGGMVIDIKNPKYPDYLLLKIGKLQTAHEDEAEVESRGALSRGEIKRGFIDAIILKFTGKAPKIGGVGEFSEENDVSILPGYGNKPTGGSNKAEPSSELKPIDAKIKIKWKDGKVMDGSSIKISGDNTINDLLNRAIKNGELYISNSSSEDNLIILSYPRKTDIGKSINNHYGQLGKPKK